MSRDLYSEIIVNNNSYRGCYGEFIDDLKGLRNFVVCKPLGSKGEHLVEDDALRAIGRYEAGQRSGAWIKIKLHLEQEFVIGGYTEPECARKYSARCS